MRLGLVAAAFYGAQYVAAQTQPKTPPELIRYLTYQSDRPDKYGMVKGRSVTFSCGPALGEARDNRALTRALVGFGSAAVPALEDALDSFEARGRESGGEGEAKWLMLAYARLKGPAALPRLRRMYGNPRLPSYLDSLDASVALAFGFTSYLSSLRGTRIYQYRECVENGAISTLSLTPCPSFQKERPIRWIRCDRGNEPRDSLDRLILAWQADNRTAVEATLGPRAKSALREALENRSWDSLRKELQSGTSGRNVGMGYRFNAPGRWSEPDETLEEEREPTNLADVPNSFELETLFYDSLGHSCGRRRLSFLAVPESGWYRDGHPSSPVPGPIEYLIEESNISDLLRLVFTCGAENSAGNRVP
ncbi:MAG: hypothetical protein JST11_11625 [Acidobacteria bacterium]|nr:hypothetical protein [Acidobacteriota bacterium]